MKLFTIGDSISQGFMSGAAARTDLSFSTLVARSLGLSVGTSPNNADYLIPEWPMDGLPLNLETASRKVMKRIGNNIDVWDWLSFLNTVRGYADNVEDYYERGDGRVQRPFGEAPMFHNMAVQGFDVADAWLITPELCRRFINEAEEKSGGDDFAAVPSAFFYRTALNVLNPSRDPNKERWTVLDWLEHHATTEGIENLFLWLGSNNALGTVISLQVKATNDNRVISGKVESLQEIHDTGDNYCIRKLRQKYFNLWSPHDFAWEYKQLMDRIDAIMKKNVFSDWKVFVGNVPAVTVAPLAKGVGENYSAKDPFGVLKDDRGAQYYKYYTYILFDYDFAHKNDCKLTFAQIYSIDKCIARYNKTIAKQIKSKNKSHNDDRYVLVDICKALLELAFKRNNGSPTYDFPPEVENKFPIVDTRFHHATSRGNLEQGGVFSLDGIHPSAIGHGLIAHEFMKAMAIARPTEFGKLRLNWDDIYKSDELFTRPISLMQSVRAKAEDMAKFALWLAKVKGRF